LVDAAKYFYPATKSSTLPISNEELTFGRNETRIS
jgi:hypothetical protein